MGLTTGSRKKNCRSCDTFLYELGLNIVVCETCGSGWERWHIELNTAGEGKIDAAVQSDGIVARNPNKASDNVYEKSRNTQVLLSSFR